MRQVPDGPAERVEGREGPVASSPNSAREEWRQHWKLVLAALVGSSLAALPVQAIAFFIDPLTQAFGWSRVQATVGLSIFALVVVPLSPVAGMMIDRWGARRMAMSGLALTAIAFGSLGLTTGSFSLWIFQWTIYALLGLTIKMTVWTAAVSSVFRHGRGMAIAVTLCGTALAQTIAPLLSYYLIEQFGWRLAYIVMAVGWGGLSFILTALFFFDGRQRGSAAKQAAGAIIASDAAHGLSVGQALRCLSLYRLALALVINSILSIAVVTNKVGIVGEMGISRGAAAQIAATAGIAGISGKLLTGWLYDRSSSQWIGIAAFGVPAIGFTLMLDPLRTEPLLVLGMILFGFGSGATLQASVYLTARYAGLRNYGKIYGTLSAVTALGIGVGPLLGGAIYDHFHSYGPLIILGVPLGLLSGLLVTRLGPYPQWERQS
ncbi:MAG: MFS transporter [Sphingobium sp.]